MKQIQTLNAISKVVKTILPADDYAIQTEVENPDGILVRSAKMNEMKFGDSLKAIARAGAGVNNIPVDRCSKEGIVVFNTPGANANAVKELVFGSMMLSARHLVEAVNWSKTLLGKEDLPTLVENGKKQFVGHELMGKTLGVIGLGAIGAAVASFGYAIGMNVLGYDPYITVEHAWGLTRAVERVATIEELVANSDYITIHVPLSLKTHGLFDENACAGIKQGATLLNFSRGELVHMPSVISAIESGQIGQYITDFPTEELLAMPKVICLPHLGASTPESEENCARMAAQQLKDFLENGNVMNSVNFPDCVVPKNGKMRIGIIHTNTPNMIGQFTGALSGNHINIANLLNKSRGEYAYTIIDLDENADESTLKSLRDITGVIRLTIY